LKKEAKTFVALSQISGASPRQRAKVFWFFFSKKNCFLPVLVLVRLAREQVAHWLRRLVASMVQARQAGAGLQRVEQVEVHAVTT
jgi:hypothetical protein